MDTLAPPILDTIDQILQNAWNQNRSILFEHEVYRILDLLELDTPPVHFIRGASDITPQDLSRFSSDTLMMKIVSPTVAHKMAVNGVRSVYRDLDFLKYSCERLQQEVAALGHPVDGVLLVDHIPYTKDLGNEILLGFRESDAFGPVISFSKGGTIAVGGQTRALCPSICDIADPVDLAVVAVPAEHSVAVVEECAQKGVRAIILIPGGFSETRKNRKLEQEILAIARRQGIRIIGPNCLGIVYSGNRKAPGINTFFVPEEKFRINLEKDNNVAILSQSGALGITEIYNLRNAISPKVIVSYGTQLDVDPADLVAYFDRDPEVDVIGCYIEGFKAAGGRKFFNTARQTNTPIIVYKAGRTAAGKQATESHTASIAGEYQVAKAAMKQAGLIVAETMIDHGDFIKTFALLSDFDVRGNRVALIANAGYEKTYAADNLGRLQIAAFDPATHDALAKLLPPYVTVDPLLDLTPMAGDAMYADCIRTILQSDTVDALMISIVPHSILLHTTDDEIARTEGHLAERIVDLIHTYKKPTVVSVNVAFGAGAVYNRFGQILDSGGVPTFLTANRAMICLNAFVHYRLTRH
jgi:acyl-CoA synthetase (NDP forming)